MTCRSTSTGTCGASWATRSPAWRSSTCVCPARPSAAKHRKTVEWIDGGLRCPTCGITPKNAHQGFVMVEIPMMTDEEIEAIFKQRAGTLRSALNNGHHAGGGTRLAVRLLFVRPCLPGRHDHSEWLCIGGIHDF